VDGRWMGLYGRSLGDTIPQMASVWPVGGVVTSLPDSFGVVPRLAESPPDSLAAQEPIHPQPHPVPLYIVHPLLPHPSSPHLLARRFPEQTLPRRFPHVTLDEFVIMPDHVHFILWLDGTRAKGLRLGNVVGACKSLTTVLWLQHLKSVGKDMWFPCRIWQGGYYERVVRIDELEQTRQYIRNNPPQGRLDASGGPT